VNALMDGTAPLVLMQYATKAVYEETVQLQVTVSVHTGGTALLVILRSVTMDVLMARIALMWTCVQQVFFLIYFNLLYFFLN